MGVRFRLKRQALSWFEAFRFLVLFHVTAANADVARVAISTAAAVRTAATATAAMVGRQGWAHC